MAGISSSGLAAAANQYDGSGQIYHLNVGPSFRRPPRRVNKSLGAGSRRKLGDLEAQNWATPSGWARVLNRASFGRIYVEPGGWPGRQTMELADSSEPTRRANFISWLVFGHLFDNAAALSARRRLDLLTGLVSRVRPPPIGRARKQYPTPRKSQKIGSPTHISKDRRRRWAFPDVKAVDNNG